MTIEVALVISALSLAFGIYQGVSNMKRNQKVDNTQEASQMTTVIVKLETISAGISEIKSDMRNVKDEVRELRDRLIKVEGSVKHAHRRIADFHNAEKGGNADEHQLEGTF